MPAGYVVDELQILFPLSDNLLKGNFLLASLKHPRWGIEENDQIGAWNKPTYEFDQPQRASVAVALGVSEAIVIVAVKKYNISFGLKVDQVSPVAQCPIQKEEHQFE
jgi:hypothetical protein